MSDDPTTTRFLDTNEGKSLLQRAEEYLKDTTHPCEDLTENEIRWLVQRLRIYQVELEMQNEELKRTRQQQEESKFRYMHLFHLAPVGLAVVSKEGIFKRVNSTLTEMLGRPDAELIDMPLQDLLTKESREIFLARFKAYFNNPDQKILECDFTRGNDENLVLQINGRVSEADCVLNQPNTGQNVLLLSFQPVTGYGHRYPKQKDEEKYDVPAEMNGLLIQTLSTDGYYRSANTTWFKTLGYEPTDIASLHFNDVCHCDNSDTWQQVMASLEAGTSAVDLKLELLNRDGKAVEVEGAMVGIWGERGRLLSILGYFTKKLKLNDGEMCFDSNGPQP